MSKSSLGLVHIYCGDGKGKTTCSVGLSVRAAGYGLNVLFLQFLKDGTSSELKVLKTLPTVTVVGTKPIKKFSFQMTDEEKRITREENASQFKDTIKLIEEKNINLFVIDECLGSIEAGLLDEELIVSFLENKPEELEVVLTGRNPSEKLISIANYVSRIEKRAITKILREFIKNDTKK